MTLGVFAANHLVKVFISSKLLKSVPDNTAGSVSTRPPNTISIGDDIIVFTDGLSSECIYAKCATCNNLPQNKYIPVIKEGVVKIKEH